MEFFGGTARDLSEFLDVKIIKKNSRKSKRIFLGFPPRKKCDKIAVLPPVKRGITMSYKYKESRADCPTPTGQSGTKEDEHVYI